MRFSTLLLLLFPAMLVAQHRYFDRPAALSRSVLMDGGSGNTLIAAEQRFGGFDSTYLHLLRADADQQLTTLGGVRLLSPLSFLNTATPVSDGAILSGANLGFSTNPFALRMDTLGNVVWSSYFSNTTNGQDQIIGAFADGNRLDLFTYSSPAAASFYMIVGDITGNFPASVRVHAPTSVDYRIDEVVPAGSPRSYVLACGANGNGGTEDIYVIGMDSTAVLWAVSHDHGSNTANQFEEVHGMVRTSTGSYFYQVNFTDSVLGYRSRLVHIASDGSIIWAREYLNAGSGLYMGTPLETADGGFLVAAGDALNSESLVLRLDANGEPIWSKHYVQSNTNSSAFGIFFQNDQGALFAYTNAVITETDEDINVCDMEPHSGVTSVLVNPITSVVSLTITQPVLNVVDMPYFPRSGSFANQISCTQNFIAESSKAPALFMYPNPVTDQLHVESSIQSGAVQLHVMDVEGRVVRACHWNAGGTLTLDLTDLHPGTYVVRMEHAGHIIHGRFVKG